MKKWLWILLFAANAAHASATESLQRFFDDVRSYSASFEQTVVDEKGAATQRSSGRMWLQRPGKFRWDYATPYEQHIVSDGNKVWIYDVELEQVTVRTLSGALGEVPALLLAGKGQLEETFAVTERGTKDGLDWVQLTPKNKESGFDSISLGFGKGRLAAMEMVDGFGQTTRISLREPRENPAIDAAKFSFKPPAGVDVVEQ